MHVYIDVYVRTMRWCDMWIEENIYCKCCEWRDDGDFIPLILFNVCAFPYYYVMAGFLTPYFVVMFSVWWLYLEYIYPGW